MKKIILIAVIIFILWLIFGKNKEPDVWTGYYYPNIENMEYFLTSHRLSSLDECRRWVNSNVKYEDNYDYECGLNCKMNTALGVDVCKETVQ